MGKKGKDPVWMRATAKEWTKAATTKGSPKLAAFKLTNRKGRFLDNLKISYGKKGKK